MTNIFDGLIGAIDKYLAKADDDLTDEFSDEGRAYPEDTVDAINELEDEIADALVLETKYFVKEIRKRKTISELLDVLEEIKAKDAYCDRIRDAVSKQLRKLIPRFTEYYIQEIDNELTVTKVSARTIAWIDDWSTELANLMKLTSTTQIENILKQGLANDMSVEEVARTIQDGGIRNEHYRARTTSLTEMLRAHNVSRWEADMQNPSVTEHKWRHTGAHKNEPRENHVEMDGQTVPKGTPFTLIGADGATYYPLYPVDPILPPEESINCHCISQAIVDEDILVLPLAEREQLQQQAIDDMDDEWEKELDARNRARAGIEE